MTGEGLKFEIGQVAKASEKVSKDWERFRIRLLSRRNGPEAE